MLDLYNIQATLGGLGIILTVWNKRQEGFSSHFSRLLPPHTLPPDGMQVYRDLNGITAAETLKLMAPLHFWRKC